MLLWIKYVLSICIASSSKYLQDVFIHILDFFLVRGGGSGGEEILLAFCYSHFRCQQSFPSCSGRISQISVLFAYYTEQIQLR